MVSFFAFKGLSTFLSTYSQIVLHIPGTMSKAPRAFLATKSWHTGNKNNLERVKEREQKDAAERKKLLELQKELAEEREHERFEELQEKSGLKVRDVKAKQKLSWMYRGPQQTDEERAKEAEAVLLGEKEASLDKKGGDASDDKAAEKTINDRDVIGSLWLQGKASAENEAFHLRHEDPLAGYVMSRNPTWQIEKLAPWFFSTPPSQGASRVFKISPRF
ncbi:Hypothetical Protein FCC1311_014682 [Hondaea fermentalgiana]|uniref:CBF1-interacting co-repressor CIR N-terminal domain-containing protein n=1 Tax=Hondaea fermentalgiana TaxID=2315210 RepID=A0A2R5GAY0_9STRA|nr:Hypothetical Protein FCC1311_014682 [Hondaea fermentalgiana]|eukprot:GBG25251.1 Hypothetical Protein FCC1311_014682 [Hondaea fermentalgiana]